METFLKSQINQEKKFLIAKEKSKLNILRKMNFVQIWKHSKAKKLLVSSSHLKVWKIRKVPPEEWQTRKLDDILLWLFNAV